MPQMFPSYHLVMFIFFFFFMHVFITSIYWVGKEVFLQKKEKKNFFKKINTQW